jgi:HD superfamily phosphohydrolase YqeK
MIYPATEPGVPSSWLCGLLMKGDSMKENFITIVKLYIKREGRDRLMSYLESTDFFTAPASSAHHLAYEGGLLEHSTNVYSVIERRAREQCPGENPESLAICGLFHDIAKVNQYQKTKRSRKTQDSAGNFLTDYKGKPIWEEYDTWETIQTYCPMGHGEKSVWLLSQYIKLTEEEALAIRWHMGPWTPGVTTDFQTGQIYAQAVKQAPLLMALYLADMEATHIVEAGITSKADELPF